MGKTYVCVLILVALSARADIYRCTDSAGQLRFTDDASSCETAHPVIGTRGREQPCREPQNCPPPASRIPNPVPVERDVDLSANFLPAIELGSDWSLVEQAPEPIDPELRRYGLVDTYTRHYARSSGGTSEVCSVELWRFQKAGEARGVARSLKLPHWLVLRAGSLLVLTHGVRLALGADSDSRLQRVCVELGRLTRQRIARKGAPRPADSPQPH